MAKYKYWRSLYEVVDANAMVALWHCGENKEFAVDHAKHCVMNEPKLRHVSTDFQGWEVPNAVLGVFLPAGSKHG